MINKKRMLKSFISLAKIKSPSFNEKVLKDFLIKELKPYAKQIISDKSASKTGSNTGNLIVKIKGSSNKNFLLSSHMDTVAVEKEIRPIVKKGKVFSDGSTILGADCKAGIAIMIEIVKTIKERKIPSPNLELVFTVCEELGLLGAKHLDYSLLKSKEGLVFDNEQDFENLILNAPAADYMDIILKGKAAHSGVAARKGLSAIKLAAETISKMRLGQLDKITTANIGFISGGSGINIVPDTVCLKGEIRSLNAKRLPEIKKSYLKALNSVFSKKEHLKFGAKYEFKTSSKFPPLKIDSRHELVRCIKKSMRDFNLEMKKSASGGGTDANIFHSKSIITPILSTGMKDVHTNKEYLKLDDFFLCANLTLEIIKKRAT